MLYLNTNKKVRHSYYEYMCLFNNGKYTPCWVRQDIFRKHGVRDMCFFDFRYLSRRMLPSIVTTTKKTQQRSGTTIRRCIFFVFNLRDVSINILPERSSGRDLNIFSDVYTAQFTSCFWGTVHNITVNRTCVVCIRRGTNMSALCKTFTGGEYSN